MQTTCCSSPVCAHWVPHGEGSLRLSMASTEHAVGICSWTEMVHEVPMAESEREVLGESVSMWERHLLMRRHVQKQQKQRLSVTSSSPH